jgi:bifunctional non-homologous end joining protein LigD
MPETDDKLMFPEIGIRKSDLVEYYAGMAGTLSAHLYARFLTLHRFPDGIDAEGFYQQRRSDYFPREVHGNTVATADGDARIEHIHVDSEQGLRFLAGQATIEFHGWLSPCSRHERPDKMVFDLDPDGHPFEVLVSCARHLRKALEDRGLTAFVMTTGSRGLHVVTPLDGSADFDAARKLARGIADAVAAEHDGDYTTEQRKKARKGRLYLDTSRNAYGQTSVMPYSLRARPDAPVATPLDWDELGRGDMGPRRYHIRNIRRRLAQKADPWRNFFAHAAGPGT